MSAAEPGPSHPAASGQRPAPVNAAERIVSMDAIRGVAILGILVMNIYAFAMPFIGYSNPLAIGGTGRHNLATWFFTHFLFDQKFLSIFAMLFGAGIVMLTQRAEQRGGKPARLYYRRQFWLLILGALHAYFIWFGDILFSYAAVGMIAYLFRKLATRTLVVLSVLLISTTALLGHGFSYEIEDMRAQAEDYGARVAVGEALSDEQQKALDDWGVTRKMMAPSEQDIRDDLEAHSGRYAGIFAHRLPIAAGIQQGTVFFFGWRILGLMLLGIVLMRSGILSGEKEAAFYKGFMLVGYGLGLPLTVFSGLDLYAHTFEPIYTLRYGYFANSFGSVLVAFGHIGVVMLVVTTDYVPGLMRRFAAVGRLALSNYLMHSVLLTTIFYGYGLGLYGQIPRFWQMGFVAATIALQLFLSPWWLRRYRFGPVEWLWRSATYWRLQPMRQSR